MGRVAFGLLFALSVAAPALAQDADMGTERRQWSEQIRQQRARVEAMRRDRRVLAPPPPPTDEQLADERVRRAFDDPYLVPGDVVVTRQGYFQYRGTPMDRERQPQDFVRVSR